MSRTDGARENSSSAHVVHEAERAALLLFSSQGTQRSLGGLVACAPAGHGSHDAE